MDPVNIINSNDTYVNQYNSNYKIQLLEQYLYYKYAITSSYYGHLGTDKKCPDYQGVLIFQVILYDKVHLLSQLSVWIMQVSLFSSLHNYRFHCITYYN